VNIPLRVLRPARFAALRVVGNVYDFTDDNVNQG
jgi:hypothetical protein